MQALRESCDWRGIQACLQTAIPTAERIRKLAWEGPITQVRRHGLHQDAAALTRVLKSALVLLEHLAEIPTPFEDGSPEDQDLLDRYDKEVAEVTSCP